MIAEYSDSPPQNPPRQPIGPFVTAVVSLIISLVELGILLGGMKLTLVSVLAVVIPGMTISTTLIAVSMGWIFISIGRSKRQPRWVVGTGVLIAINMLVLLALTYMTEK